MQQHYSHRPNFTPKRMRLVQNTFDRHVATALHAVKRSNFTQRRTRLTQSSLDNHVAVVGCPSSVEALHPDAVLCVGLEVRQQVVPDARPLQHLHLKLLIQPVGLVVDVEPIDGGRVHRKVL